MANKMVEIQIRKYIQEYIIKNGPATIEELIDNYHMDIPITASEITKTIIRALEDGYLIVETNKIISSTKISLIKEFPDFKESTVKIVISKPRLKELSLSVHQSRNKLMETTQCFKIIISSARNVLRICSPFIQKDVLSKDTFPELKYLVVNALQRGVKIKVLSRELHSHRSDEIKWLRDIAKKMQMENNLEIVDYHILSEGGKVISSTHAKLLIADNKMAYIGSAELRKNSLVANFEVGCLITGYQVIGICEIFDEMFEKGRL